MYCRVRPFLPGQREKKTTIEQIDENGGLIIANPTKPGKDGQRLFKFNKVFSPSSTQGVLLHCFRFIIPLLGMFLFLYL